MNDAACYWDDAWSGMDTPGWESPWMNRDLVDGNPIFTAWSPSERKGIRVIECDADPREMTFHYWFDRFDNDVRELVIYSDGSPGARGQAGSLMRDYVQGAIMQSGPESPFVAMPWR